MDKLTGVFLDHFEPNEHSVHELGKISGRRIWMDRDSTSDVEFAAID